MSQRQRDDFGVSQVTCHILVQLINGLSFNIVSRLKSKVFYHPTSWTYTVRPWAQWYVCCNTEFKALASGSSRTSNQEVSTDQKKVTDQFLVFHLYPPFNVTPCSNDVEITSVEERKQSHMTQLQLHFIVRTLIY